MKLYIAGPMTGIPQFNIPAFDAAAAQLRRLGHEVINPAEEDSPSVRTAALASENGALLDLEGSGETWGDMLARDVRLVADGVEGVVLLPGWANSRGALLEATVAFLCRKQLFECDVAQALPYFRELDRGAVYRRIRDGLEYRT